MAVTALSFVSLGIGRIRCTISTWPSRHCHLYLKGLVAYAALFQHGRHGIVICTSRDWSHTLHYFNMVVTALSFVSQGIGRIRCTISTWPSRHCHLYLKGLVAYAALFQHGRHGIVICISRDWSHTLHYFNMAVTALSFVSLGIGRIRCTISTWPSRHCHLYL